MNMSKVFIVGMDYEIYRMFIDNSWQVVERAEDADLLQFTGGSDVDPSLYGEERHPTTYSDPERDAYESHFFRTWYGSKPMAGICRGGQFLNVMCGGKLWQDVDGHAGVEDHLAFCLWDKSYYYVTSTHHQMMIPGADAELLMVARESSYRESGNSFNYNVMSTDIEAVKYDNILCFQPHPEYVDGDNKFQQLYFKLLKEII
jgi:gamma-glutamyl-gamma-aminobutyrate hydrolase PuuD